MLLMFNREAIFLFDGGKMEREQSPVLSKPVLSKLA